MGRGGRGGTVEGGDVHGFVGGTPGMTGGPADCLVVVDVVDRVDDEPVDERPVAKVPIDVVDDASIAVVLVVASTPDIEVVGEWDLTATLVLLSPRVAMTAMPLAKRTTATATITP
jgi:hypothetical protein